MTKGASVIFFFGAWVGAIALVSPMAKAHGQPCTRVADTDECPLGEQCSELDGGPGTCRGRPCASSSECIAPRKRCDLSLQPPECVECRFDNECADAEGPRRRCEIDPRSPMFGACVECALGQVGGCDHEDAGSRCTLFQGLCGCSMDEDCKSPTRECSVKAICVDRLPDDAAAAVHDVDDGGRRLGDDEEITSVVVPITLAGRGGGDCTVRSETDEQASTSSLLSFFVMIGAIVVSCRLFGHRSRA